MIRKEIDPELEGIKQEVGYFAEKELRKMFPENYQEDSAIEIFLDLSSDPILIMTTTDGNPTTEGIIGKIELNLETFEGEYSVIPFIIIWAKPSKKTINISLDEISNTT